MFAAMLLSNLSALLAVAKRKKYRLYAMLAFLSLAIGGMILGPIVQKFAFGEFWTGIPFGYDLTDNKTLIAFIFWTLAFILNLKGRRPWVVVLAAVILLAVYSIPHSMMGSELNYSSGQITTG
ncbi:MAG: hypothetical protein C0594_03040 [Marinilabiliales bacterium]|nr:MAG: hypothetical protein C0594_03040 [Marinilabiliales bacterium]